MQRSYERHLDFALAFIDGLRRAIDLHSVDINQRIGRRISPFQKSESGRGPTGTPSVITRTIIVNLCLASNLRR